MTQRLGASGVRCVLEDCLAQLRTLSPGFFGFAFARAYYDVLADSCASLVVAWPLMGADLVIVGMVPAFIACVALRQRVLPLSSHGHLPWLTAALMMLGAVLLVGARSAGIHATALLVAAALVGGLGTGLSILLWAEVQSCCAPLHLALAVSGAFFAGSLLGWIASGLLGMRLFAAMLALPLCSSACATASLSHVHASETPAGASEPVRFPWKLVATLGVYEFALGVRQGASSFSDGAFSAGVLIASAALFVTALVLSRRFDLTYVYRTPFALMSCGLLAAFASLSGGSLLADLLVSCGYALMFLVLTILLCDIARRCRISAALLCSVEELVMLTSLPGHALGSAQVAGLVPLAPNGPVTLVCLGALVIVASILLLTEREYERWGFSLFGVAELAEQARRSRREQLAKRCVRLARERQLSPREFEVLALAVDGMSATQISQRLCIAPGTLKSHTRRIYRKCGVHRREELLALLEQMPPDANTPSGPSPTA